jgi:hypothetical protein
MKTITKKRQRYLNLVYFIIFYLLISIILYIFVKEFGLWAALSMTATNYRLMGLVITTIFKSKKSRKYHT